MSARASPDILGALLDVTASAMGVLSQVRLDKSPRMADFALGGSGLPRIGSPPGTFLKAYMANRNDANTSIIENSAACDASGRADGHARSMGRQQQRAALRAEQTGRRKHAGSPGVARDPRKLSGDLRRMAQSLRDTGLDLDFGDRTGSGRQRRLIRIRRIVTSNPGVGEVPSAPYASAPDAIKSSELRGDRPMPFADGSRSADGYGRPADGYGPSRDRDPPGEPADKPRLT